MGRTPDRAAGVRFEEGIILEDEGITATAEGEVRYAGGRFSLVDSIGEYDPRSGGSLPSPTAVGQVLISLDGVSFTAETPLTSDDGGWITDDDGCLLVSG